MFKVVIAGSRGFNNYPLLKNILNHFFSEVKEEIEIVSGTARGADQYGERYSVESGHKLKRMPADWDRYGKSAGYRRNEEMAQYADACIVFWDGSSKGTKHMIDLAVKYKLKLRIVKYFNLNLNFPDKNTISIRMFKINEKAIINI